jgi:hypothetical protein
LVDEIDEEDVSAMAKIFFLENFLTVLIVIIIKRKREKPEGRKLSFLFFVKTP